jgi:hypothetical protein
MAVTLAMSVVHPAIADESDDHGDGGHWRPVYQRHAFEWKDHGRRDDKFRRHSVFVPPQVNAAWFQRPYPYHLDYYKMRYGGSYAPYFGNLYGPPQVVTAPPYYGPYYGDFGYGANGYQNGYPGAYEEIPPQAPFAPGGWGNAPGANAGAMPQAPAE